MDEIKDKDYAAEYAALRAANDQLRESAKQSLFGQCDIISSEISRELAPPLQTGRGDWEFKIDKTVLVGERYGARYREKTLIVEIGWPRLPEHGFVSNGGFALGRVGISQNVMLQTQPIAHLILMKSGSWHSIHNNKIGEQVTDTIIKLWFDQLFV